MSPTEVNGIECRRCGDRYRSFETYETHDCEEHGRDAAVITFRPVRGDDRRVRIEHADGVETQFWAVHEEWDGSRWRAQGREPLRDAIFKVGEAVKR